MLVVVFFSLLKRGFFFPSAVFSGRRSDVRVCRSTVVLLDRHIHCLSSLASLGDKLLMELEGIFLGDCDMPGEMMPI
jgi:hypothetical protein